MLLLAPKTGRFEKIGRFCSTVAQKRLTLQFKRFVEKTAAIFFATFPEIIFCLQTCQKNKAPSHT
jgi:hypothetical protein